MPDATGTRVELVHSGFEAHAEDAVTGHESYDTGWDVVLCGSPNRPARPLHSGKARE